MRTLSEHEIDRLLAQGCTCEDWSQISVSEDFSAEYVENTRFIGNVSIGSLSKYVDIDEGIRLHSSIRNVTLINTTIGDNCVIENIGQYIANTSIGDNCYICNCARIATTPGATFGEGNVVAVLNEGGNGNVMLFSGLSAQMAALMVRYSDNKAMTAALRKMVLNYIEERKPEMTSIGDNVKIVNTTDIINCNISSDCEISGATKLSECTLTGSTESPVFVGSGVIIENTIAGAGASITDGAKADNCFVGEACHLGKGFSAESSIFFANSYMDNGEACAAFCGPFTVSHHKSTLLIGGEYSFYNAGSNTNFSNHAYKMGPIHYGTLMRGAKTASGSHILMPATIGAFSTCLGKIQNHPDTSVFPFSYVIGQGDTSYIVPGRNLMTVGTYRDVNKWPTRDVRPKRGRQSLICFNWLSPLTLNAIIKAKQQLSAMREEQGTDLASYNYNGNVIKNQSLQKGLHYYDLAIRMYLGEVLSSSPLHLPESSIGSGEWVDLSGLLSPLSEVDEIIAGIENGSLTDIAAIEEAFSRIFSQYESYCWSWTYRKATDFYGLEMICESDIENIRKDAEEAKTEWLNAIKFDAEREFNMGDVSEEQLQKFISSLK